MKFKLLLILFLGTIIIFIIYKVFNDQKIYYTNIGDNLLNQNKYNYYDYIKTYYQTNDKSIIFNNDFSNSSNRLIDTINAFNNNDTPNKLNIKQVLRKTNLLTISIGNNDLLQIINYPNQIDIKDINNIYKELDNLLNNYEVLLDLIKYYSDSPVYIIGFYNPILLSNSMYNILIESIIDYLNSAIKEMSLKRKFIFIDSNILVGSNQNYILSNSIPILNNYGYKLIGEKITKKIR